MPSLIEVIAEAVFEGEKPAKAVASEIGKPYRTLMRELNEFDDGAKLGVEMLIPVMRSTGSISPLQYLAAAMGYRIVKIDLDDAGPDELQHPHVPALRAVTDFLEAHASGMRFYPLRVLLDKSIRALETLWIQRRAEDVAYSIEPNSCSWPQPEPAHRTLWARWFGRR